MKCFQQINTRKVNVVYSILLHSDVPFYMYVLRVSGKYAKFITGIRHGSER